MGSKAKVTKRRRRFSLEQKRNVVMQIRNLQTRKGLSWKAATARLGVNESATRRWAKIIEFLDSNPPTTILPTERDKRPRKPKLLVPTQYACPHCGGPVILANGGGQ